MEENIVICRNCGASKPESEFYRHKSRGNKIVRVCKPCTTLKFKASAEKRKLRVIPETPECVVCGENKPRREFSIKADRIGNRPVCLICRKKYCEQHGIDMTKKYVLPKILVIDGKKRCSGCKRNLLLESFGKNSTAPLGLHWKCKECHNSEQYTYVKQRHEENPLIFWQSRLANAHVYGDCGDVTPQFLENLYLAGPCAYCGYKFKNRPESHIDHKVSRAKGGKTMQDNICLSCEPCNRAKTNMDEADFFAWQRAYYELLKAKYEPKSLKETAKIFSIVDYSKGDRSHPVGKIDLADWAERGTGT